MTKIIAYCGINCAECPAYLAYANDDESTCSHACHWRAAYDARSDGCWRCLRGWLCSVNCARSDSKREMLAHRETPRGDSPARTRYRSDAGILGMLRVWRSFNLPIREGLDHTVHRACDRCH